MRSLRLFPAIVATIVALSASAAAAGGTDRGSPARGGIDRKDPRRAVAMDDNIRIDAKISQESVGNNTPIAVTYEIQNLTASPVAVADRISDCSYDPDSQIITLSIGSEVPSDGSMPHLVVVGPGERKRLSGVARVRLGAPFASRVVSVPRYVQIRVNVLRDLVPFAPLISQQQRAPQATLKLGDDLFNKWIQSNDALLLSAIPVRWSSVPERRAVASADE